MVVWLLAFATGCTPLASRDERPARSTLGCAQRVLDEKVPEQIPEDIAHCLAAGFIARYCSVSEAYLASIGKELKDAVTPGDTEWRDWQSDRHGIACAKAATSEEDLYRCCGFSQSKTRE
jgi:hypothetical protein